mmetsp:Transcript_22633/g.56626  ORF Transcript_22633/g.56626 Transcript_22633/m.56626 type:complete len:272 (+) Transcript_22633:717-1532(+)
MVQRAVTSPKAKPRRAPDGVPHEGIRAANGLYRVHTLSEIRSNGRCQSAPGAMRILGVDPLVGEPRLLPRLRLVQEVGGFPRAKVLVVPALEEHPLDASVSEVLGGHGHGGLAVHLPAEEQLGLGDVGGDEPGQGEELVLDGGDRLHVDQRVPAGGHHHRVDHPLVQLARGRRGADGGDVLGGGDHARLDDVAAKVGDARGDLLFQEVSLRHPHPLNTQRILRSERAHSCHRVGPHRLTSLYVRLYSRSSPRIGPSNDQHPGRELVQGSRH